MAAAPRPAVTWKAHRGRTGSAEVAHAPDLPSEAAAMRDRIERLRAEGIPYDQQAVLARTHLCLARFSRQLQNLGVPVLYLGDLFERPEIRDLLALVSLGADPAGAGLVRVAGFPEYGATRDDALKVIAEAAASGQDVIAVCARATALPGLTERGGIGMVRLAAHLAGVEWTTTAWRMLATYLLEASDYLKPNLNADDARSRQRLVAIYQLLKFAREHADTTQGRGGRRRFLEDIRRLERLDDERQFRAVPPEADGLPAVRMMTIHASKGLEFRAVHLPQTATRYVPGPRRPSTCPVPLGLEHLEVQPADHAAEEECLFFVALSRARDVLSISSASTYTGKQTCNPSKYLKPLAPVLGPTRAVASRAPATKPMDCFVVAPRENHEERHLETYMKCPARYRHEKVEGLSALAEKSAYLRFHGCVRQVLAWMGDKACAGEAVTAPEAVAYLDVVWQHRGPSGGFEAVYLAEARRMVSAAAAMPDAGHRPVDRVLSVDVAGHTVVVRPDRVLEAPDGSIIIRRFRTGRKSKSEEEKPIWALLAAAGHAAFPGRVVHLQAFYPAAAEIVPIVPERDGTELAPYANALAGVARGAFEPVTSRDCPTCQFYFICTAEDSF